jgi:hypothetical protein
MSRTAPTLASAQIDTIVQQIVPALMDALLPKIAAEVQQMIPAVFKETIAQMDEKEAEGTDSEEADDGSDFASEDDEDIPDLINQPRRQRLQIENTSAPPPPAQRIRRPRYPRLPGPTPE